jgi:hypothetical protein
MMRVQKLIRGILLVVLFLPACGGKSLTKTEGVVTLDGQPLSGAMVLFNPEAPDGSPAHATSESDGTFHLKTDEAEGAAPGSYRVTVLNASKLKRTANTLPNVYSSKDTTPLQFTGPHDGPITLELKSGAR